jgi:hypothetical protein
MMHDPSFDFQLSNGLYYEMKYDNKASTTGSIFIEKVQFNKSSGIIKNNIFFFKKLTYNLKCLFL